MHEPPEAASSLSEEFDDNVHHVNREKKIGNSTIAHLLRSTKRIVEEEAWGSGMVWYPSEMLRRTSPSKLADRVFPELGTVASKACARSIGDYTGKPLTEDEARSWLANEIGKRLDRYVIGARDKIGEIRLVVTERTIDVRAERPETTRKTVGPAPWGTRL